MGASWQINFFEALYKNPYLYRFASTVPFRGQWRNWQRLILPRLQGHSVLELGCGLGDLMVDIIEAGYHCRAIESSSEMVDAARSTLRKHHPNKVNWVTQGKAQQLPFPSSLFDSVVVTFPSQYIYDPKTISEIERVLRPGGRLIILFNAKLLPVNPIQSFLLLIQTFIYGFSIFSNSSMELYKNRKSNVDIISEVIVDPAWGKQILLEKNNLKRRCELVYNYYWEAYIVIGEKSKVLY